jgi:hypothetical protein
MEIYCILLPDKADIKTPGDAFDIRLLQKKDLMALRCSGL